MARSAREARRHREKALSFCSLRLGASVARRFLQTEKSRIQDPGSRIQDSGKAIAEIGNWKLGSRSLDLYRMVRGLGQSPFSSFHFLPGPVSTLLNPGSRGSTIYPS
jgi:hypothetical protein